MRSTKSVLLLPFNILFDLIRLVRDCLFARHIETAFFRHFSLSVCFAKNLCFATSNNDKFRKVEFLKAPDLLQSGAVTNKRKLQFYPLSICIIFEYYSHPEGGCLHIYFYLNHYLLFKLF